MNTVIEAYYQRLIDALPADAPRARSANAVEGDESAPLAFVLMWSPIEINDCQIVMDDTTVLGVLHGTDCTLTAKLSAGGAFDGGEAQCERRAAGGSFKMIPFKDVKGG